MAKVDELQKRVDTLQNQLRKAGDHLKRLATENGALTEQVEKLTEHEAQLQQTTEHSSQETGALKEECESSRLKIAQLEAQIAEMSNYNKTNDSSNDQKLLEWENAAAEWAKQLGFSAGVDGLKSAAALDFIKSHLQDVPSSNDSGNGDGCVDKLTKQVEKLRLDAEKERETRVELEDRLRKYADSQAAAARVLDNPDVLDSVPEAVPELLLPGLERVLCNCALLKANKTRIAEFESQLGVTTKKLDEATEAREELSRDYDLLLERIGTMKDALKAKMNAESDEVKRLRKEAASAKSDKAQHEKSIRVLEQSEKALRKELDETKRALWESQETANRAQMELTESVNESGRLVSDLKARLQAAEEHIRSESAQHDQLEDRVEQLQSDLNQALNSESQWVGEREVHLVTIQNLQSALENLQESKDAEVDLAVERLRDELRTCTKDCRSAVTRAEAAETRLRKVEHSGATAEQSQQKISELQTEIERLHHEIAVLKDHLNESMHRLREESSEFNLDKRVITNLIVGFLALPYGDSKRFEILQLMSSILQFSEEQQQKVGLIRKAGWRASVQQSSHPGTPVPESADAQASQLETKDSFSDQWISYLLRESSSTRARRA